MLSSFEIKRAKNRPILIGMVHLDPLPGSPGGGAPGTVVSRAVAEAKLLSQAGIDGLMVENYGDVPFFASSVPLETIAHLTRIATEIKKISPLPLGINVLRNDGKAALAVAHASGAEFIRVNVLTGARLTDQGIIQGEAAEILRMRQRLGGTKIQILADVDVKHSVPLSEFTLGDEIENTLTRGRADGIILSGRGTGKETSLDKITEARKHCGEIPLLVGSGVNPENVVALFGLVDAVIVGSYFKLEGKAENPIDPKRVERLVKIIKG